MFRSKSYTRRETRKLRLWDPILTHGGELWTLVSLAPQGQAWYYNPVGGFHSFHPDGRGGDLNPKTVNALAVEIWDRTAPSAETHRPVYALRLADEDYHVIPKAEWLARAAHKAHGR